uniref:Sushi domain-containing protein n=1 Tax=Zonotrichia albicollis TaxID=44394 RepID=A0A8D2NBP5_ZONAL
MINYRWQSVSNGNIPCDLPQIENGNLPQYYYSFKSYYFPMDKGKKLSYSCVVGYTTESGTQDGRITCTAKGWSPVPRCYSELALFIIASSRGISWLKLQYKCNPGYLTLSGAAEDTVQCQPQGWSSQPSCTKTLGSVHGSYAGTAREVRQNGTLRYRCQPGFRSATGSAAAAALCLPHGWDLPPRCTTATEKCGSPPSIANGALTVPALPQYDSGSSVQYICSEYHFLQGSERIYCSEGQWTSPPVCIEPCTLSKTEMEKNNVLLQAFYADQVYFYHGDYVGFYCKENHFGAESGTTLFQVQCERGQLAYPRCVEREKQVRT